MITLLRTLTLFTGLVAPTLALAQSEPAPPERIDLRVDGEPLLVLFERIARDLDLGLIADEEVIDRLSKRIRIDVPDALWADALLLFSSEYSIAVTRSEGRLHLDDADARFEAMLEKRTTPISHLQQEVGDYPSPALGFDSIDTGSSGGGSLLDLGDDVGPPLMYSLEEMIPAIAGPGTWSRMGVDLRFDRDMLLVRQIPAVHDRIAEFLREVEDRIARQVTCRIFEVDAMQTGPVLDAASTREAITGLIPRAVWVVADGQRNHSAIVRERSFIQDVEFVHHTADPICLELRTGWTFEVEPHVTRRGIQANIAIAHARSPRSGSSPVLGPDDRTTVEIEAPVLEIDDEVQSRVIPDGGASVHHLGDRTILVQVEVVE